MRNVLVLWVVFAAIASLTPAVGFAQADLVIPADSFFREQVPTPAHANAPLTILVQKSARKALSGETNVQVRMFRGVVQDILKSGWQTADKCWLYPSAWREPFKRISPDNSDAWKIVDSTSNNWLSLGATTLLQQEYLAVLERRIDGNDFVKLQTEADAKAYFARGFRLLVRAPERVSAAEFERVRKLFDALSQAHQADISTTQAGVSCVRIVKKANITTGDDTDDVGLVIPCNLDLIDTNAPTDGAAASQPSALLPLSEQNERHGPYRYLPG